LAERDEKTVGDGRSAWAAGRPEVDQEQHLPEEKQGPEDKDGRQRGSVEVVTELEPDCRERERGEQGDERDDQRCGGE
jgi:hypothetical protein